MSEVISEQDAAARKEQDVATVREQLLRDAAGGRWFASSSIHENSEAAAVYLNTPPAQGPGEAMTTVLDDGRVAVFYYLGPSS